MKQLTEKTLNFRNIPLVITDINWRLMDPMLCFGLFNFGHLGGGLGTILGQGRCNGLICFVTELLVII